MSDRYEIRIRGSLSPEVAAGFEDLEATLRPSETVLHGSLRDQAALYSVLDRLETLGVELVEVRRLVTSPGEDPE